MARQARKTASSGIYHLALRPVTGRSVFCISEDVRQFLTFVEAEKERDALEVFAYCLLPQTCHMVVREGLSGLTANMMRICKVYANYCNRAHHMAGKLFDGRFHSAPLETPEQIVDATRFVHRLPLEDGLPLAYEHSSYRHYFRQSELLSNEEILSLLPAVNYRIYCDSPCAHKFKRHRQTY